MKYRASAIGKLMTDSRSKSEALSETTKSYLLELWIEQNYGRKKVIDSKYMNKGIAVEEQSITLYSLHTGEFYKKNNYRHQNDYITGEPDIITDECIIDIKSSWDIFTFMASKHSKAINKDYYWQLQAYMDLFGKKSAKLVYVLSNTPDEIIERETRFRTCDPKEFNFDDIPTAQRICEISVDYNEDDIKRMYNRINEANEYYQSLKA
jgi:hypothetical protein